MAQRPDRVVAFRGIEAMHCPSPPLLLIHMSSPHNRPLPSTCQPTRPSSRPLPPTCNRHLSAQRSRALPATRRHRLCRVDQRNAGVRETQPHHGYRRPDPDDRRQRSHGVPPPGNWTELRRTVVRAFSMSRYRVFLQIQPATFIPLPVRVAQSSRHRHGLKPPRKHYPPISYSLLLRRES